MAARGESLSLTIFRPASEQAGAEVGGVLLILRVGLYLLLDFIARRLLLPQVLFDGLFAAFLLAFAVRPGKMQTGKVERKFREAGNE